jgi:hypothetical protein
LLLGLGVWAFACDFAPPRPENESVFDKSNAQIGGYVGENQERVARARVLLGSSPTYPDMSDGGIREAITSTDGVGSFQFLGYRRPPFAYDLTATDDSSGVRVVSHFTGVERYFGQYLLFDERPRTGWSARVHVIVEDLPPDAKVVFIAGSVPDGDWVPIVGTEITGSEVRLAWKGTYQTKLQLHAVAYVEDPATKLPLRYIGHSTSPLSVTHGGSLEWKTRVEPLETSEAELLVPDWNEAGTTFRDLDARVFLDFGELNSQLEVARPRFGTNKLMVPHMLGGRFVVHAEVTSDTGRHTHQHWFGFGPGDAKQEVTFERGRALIDPPAAGGRITPDTVFRWETGGTVRISLDAGPQGRFNVVSSTGQAQLPRQALALLGVPLPDEAPAKLTFTHYPLLKSTDVFVTPYTDMAFIDRMDAPALDVTLGR